MIRMIVFAISILLSTSAFANIAFEKEIPCSNNIIRVLSYSKDVRMLGCYVSDRLVGDKPAVFAVQFFSPNDNTTLAGVTVTIYDRQALEAGKRVPFFQMTGLGDRLVNFDYKGEMTPFAIADFTHTGNVGFAIRTFAEPHASILIIQEYSPQSRTFKSVSPHYALNKAHRFPPGEDFDTDPFRPVKILDNQIQVPVLNYDMNGNLLQKTYDIYLLKSGQFVLKE